MVLNLDVESAIEVLPADLDDGLVGAVANRSASWGRESTAGLSRGRGVHGGLRPEGGGVSSPTSEAARHTGALPMLTRSRVRYEQADGGTRQVSPKAVRGRTALSSACVPLGLVCLRRGQPMPRHQFVVHHGSDFGQLAAREDRAIWSSLTPVGRAEGQTSAWRASMDAALSDAKAKRPAKAGRS